MFRHGGRRHGPICLSNLGSLTCGSFQHGSLQHCRLPWRDPLGFSAFFSRLGSLSLFFFNTLLFPRCDSTWRAFLFSLVPSVSFSPHGSPRYGFLSARFSSESARHKSQVRVAALIIASPSTRQARTARSRGESVPRFCGWAPSSFCRSGSVFVLQLRLGPRFTTVFCVLPRLWPRLHLCGPGSQKQGWS